MDHPQGASETGGTWLSFDRRVRLEFHGSRISSDGGLLLFRELDEVLGLHELAGSVLRDSRTGHNRLHSLVGLLRQSVFGRLAGYDDVNDADRLARDPVMRQIVGGRAVDAKAASASQMGRFETEVLATSDNRSALADLSGHWIGRVHDRTAAQVDHAGHGQLGQPDPWRAAGHRLERALRLHVLPPSVRVQPVWPSWNAAPLRPGNVHSADGLGSGPEACHRAICGQP